MACLLVSYFLLCSLCLFLSVFGVHPSSCFAFLVSSVFSGCGYVSGILWLHVRYGMVHHRQLVRTLPSRAGTAVNLTVVRTGTTDSSLFFSHRDAFVFQLVL